MTRHFSHAIILDGDDDSSIKESGNDDNPEPANEEVNLANAAKTSTPDQGHLRPNSQPNSSLEFSQGKSKVIHIQLTMGRNYFWSI